ncbi:MAG: sialidase family protein [Pseudomonadota bacterium]
MTIRALSLALTFGGFALLAAPPPINAGSDTCTAANSSLPVNEQWNCYEFYLPTFKYTTLYDMIPLEVRDEFGAVETLRWWDRVITIQETQNGVPVTRRKVFCEINASYDTYVGCERDQTNTQARNWYYHVYENEDTTSLLYGPNIYNHMPALAFFDNAWWAIWSSNNRRTPSPVDTTMGEYSFEKQGKIPVGHNMIPKYSDQEGVAGQRIILSKAPVIDDPARTDQEDREHAFLNNWTAPNLDGLFVDQMRKDPSDPTSPVSPDNRQWAPDLLVVDVKQSSGVYVEELWAFFTQSLGPQRGTYWGRLQHSAQNPTAQWQVQKINFAGTDIGGIGPGGFAFSAANALQLKHQSDMSKNDRIILPVMPDNQDPDNGVRHDSAVLYTDDFGATWQTSSRLTPPPAFDIWEPIFAEHPETGTLFLYYRNFTRVDRPSSQMMLTSYSTDAGETWSPIEAMPLEVPSIGGHAFSFGKRIALIHQDFENGFSGPIGAREGVRTGRVTDAGPALGFQNNDRVNLALFFSRSGEAGTFLPGPTISTNQVTNYTNDYESGATQMNQRGTDLAHMTLMDDKLYAIHRSSRSIRGVVVSHLPDDNTFYLYPRTAADIIPASSGTGWEECPADGGTDFDRELYFTSSYCTYTVDIDYDSENDVYGPRVRVERQASLSIETEQADFAAGEMLQLQFDVRSRLPESFTSDQQRMGILTIGGPQDYGYIEIGQWPLYKDKVLFVHGDNTTVLGDYNFQDQGRIEVTVFLYEDTLPGGSTQGKIQIIIEGVNSAKDSTNPREFPFDLGNIPQKFFFGYGYTQGLSYEERDYNPQGWFRLLATRVKSRIADKSDLSTLVGEVETQAEN